MGNVLLAGICPPPVLPYIRVIQIWEITSFLGLIYGKRGEDISSNSKIGMRWFTTCASNKLLDMSIVKTTNRGKSPHLPAMPETTCFAVNLIKLIKLIKLKKLIEQQRPAPLVSRSRERNRGRRWGGNCSWKHDGRVCARGLRRQWKMECFKFVRAQNLKTF